MMKFNDRGCVTTGLAYVPNSSLLHNGPIGLGLFQVGPITNFKNWDLSAVLEYWRWYVMSGSWRYQKH